jgi:hypothetical protein
MSAENDFRPVQPSFECSFALMPETVPHQREVNVIDVERYQTEAT